MRRVPNTLFTLSGLFLMSVTAACLDDPHLSVLWKLEVPSVTEQACQRLGISRWEVRVSGDDEDEASVECGSDASGWSVRFPLDVGRYLVTLQAVGAGGEVLAVKRKETMVVADGLLGGGTSGTADFTLTSRAFNGGVPVADLVVHLQGHGIDSCGDVGWEISGWLFDLDGPSRLQERRLCDRTNDGWYEVRDLENGTYSLTVTAVDHRGADLTQAHQQVYVDVETGGDLVYLAF